MGARFVRTLIKNALHRGPELVLLHGDDVDEENVKGAQHFSYPSSGRLPPHTI